jgi:dTDP-glucose 4,6-dehydratase
MSYIVTGGCGFIGSNFVNYLCDTTDKNVFVIDKMTYAANESNIDLEHYKSGQARIYKCDLAVGCTALDKILQHSEVEGVFHFAAETHVDNSIAGPDVFIKANVQGTFN